MRIVQKNEAFEDRLNRVCYLVTSLAILYLRRLRVTIEDEKLINKDRELGSMEDISRKSRVSSLK